MTLTSDTRLRASKALEDALGSRQPLLTPRLPITDGQWWNFVDRLGANLSHLQEVNGSVPNTNADDFHAIRSASLTATEQLRAIDNMLTAASAFDHPRRPALVKLHEAVGSTARTWQASLTGVDRDEPPADHNQWQSLEQAWSDLSADPNSDSDHEGQDPWDTAFGINEARLRTPAGVFSPVLLVAEFHDRIGELQDRIDRLLSPLQPGFIPHLKAISLLAPLLALSDPARVLQTAVHTRHLIAEKFAESPETTAAALRSLLEGIERSEANMTMVNDTIRRLRETDRRGTRAMLQLELYRQFTEGQIRPWCWTLIKLQTAADGPTPMLAELGDRLRATGDPLAAAFEECLEPIFRNAAAHADYHWDGRRRRLVSREGEIDVDLLIELTERGRELMAGAELGWALACSDHEDLEVAMRAGDTHSGPDVMLIRTGVSRFATNQLRVADWEIDLDTLHVHLEGGISADHQMPFAQAVLECSTIMRDIERFEVHLPRHQGPVLVATRRGLEPMLPLWLAAQRTFGRVSPSVFLPTMFESRLLVEDADSAVEAMNSLALNEAWYSLKAFGNGDYGPLGSPSLSALALGLKTVAIALETCATLMPSLSDALQARPYRTVRGASVHAAAAAADPRRDTDAFRSLRKMNGKVSELLAAASPCTPFPALDEAATAPRGSTSTGR